MGHAVIPIPPGTTFGSWTVLARGPSVVQAKRVVPLWNVRCACGVEKALSGTVLRGGKSTKCATCAGAALKGRKVGITARVPRCAPLIPPGTVSGSWTVLRAAASRPKVGAFCLCRCACGVEREIASSLLRGGRTTRCRACYARAQTLPETPSPASAAQRSPAAEIRPQTRPCEARPAGRKPAILAPVPPRCLATDPDTGLRCTVACHGRATMCPACLDRTAWQRGQRAARRWVSA